MANSPDIASLSINSQSNQQRLHDIYDFEGNPNTRPHYHFQTSPPIPAQSQYNPLNLAQSPAKRPARGGLPTQWLDNNSDSRSLSPNNNSDFSSAGGSPPPISHINQATTLASQTPLSAASPPMGQPGDDEIIPTAIVIKNIPFNVKRETLLDIITSLSIPTPYAFNYHLDQQGAFRGLAFANFRQAVDADAVVAALNGFDVQGRKLRVEYKKVLQAGEKERIEREKAIRRMRSMQLEKEQQNPPNLAYEEYQQPPMTAPYTPQRSFSSGSPYHQQQQQQQYSPPSVLNMPQYSLSQAVSQPPPLPSTPSDKAATELDLNDPSTLEIYSRILLFKDDHMRDELAFSRTLTAKQRRVVHLIAQKLGVFHYSVGEGEDRYAVVTRIDPQRQQMQQQQQATRTPHTLSRAPSAYLNSSAPQAPPSLRVKKSMPDMKTLHSQTPRLNSRSSNGNIREGYATIANPSRRVSVPFSTLFNPNGSNYGNSVPPVPSLPSGIGSSSFTGNSAGLDGAAGVVRQPRGPGVDAFVRRDSRVGSSEGPIRGGLDARSYEPLEI
jgi:RNA recognition motif-containing protein